MLQFKYFDNSVIGKAQTFEKFWLLLLSRVNNKGCSFQQIYNKP